MHIALITKNWNFLGAIKTELDRAKHHDVVQYWPSTNETFDWTNIMNLLSWADVAFFDFAQSPLIEVSNMAVKPCKIVARMLGVDVIHNAKFVNWKNVDVLISISEHQKQRFLEMNLTNTPYISVVPLGVNVDAFQPPEEKEFGFNICQVGNMLPHKRHYETIQLFKELLDSSPPHHNWHLHIHHTTNGGWRDWMQTEYMLCCKDLVDELDIDDKVTFYDYQDDWEKGAGAVFFSDKDLVISNSQMEGYHKTPLEAMSCGVHPLINCWRGATNIYPPSLVFNTFSQAICMLKQWAELPLEAKRKLAEGHHTYVAKYHDEVESAKRIRGIFEMVYFAEHISEARKEMIIP